MLRLPLAFALLAAAPLAIGLPLPYPPWLAEPGAAPFSTVVCPLAPVPSHPNRPLELCNVRATAHTGPANEPDLAIDPQNPLHMVVVAKDYNYTRLVESSLRGGVITAHATTFDGGLTWTEGYLEAFDPDLSLLGMGIGETPDLATDPVVEFMPDGGVVAMTLRADFQELLAYRSADGGRSFAPLASVFQGFTDKEWFVADPASGNLYAATAFGGGIGFMKSTDGGITWSAPVQVLPGEGATIDTGPNGEIYLAASDDAVVRFTRSLDQGGSWDPPRAIAMRDDPATGILEFCDGRLFRTPNFAQLASSRVDSSVYAVLVDRGGFLPTTECPATPDFGIYVVRSADGGVTWNLPHRVDDGLPGFRFMPAIALSPRGDVHVAWLDQRDEPSGQTAQVFYAHSPDGQDFEPNLRVSDTPFLTSLSHHQNATLFRSHKHTGMHVAYIHNSVWCVFL